MRALIKLTVALCLVATTASLAVAADTQPLRERKPLSALAAAGLNLFYFPVRFAFTVVGAEISGLTGFLTAGNIEAAGDVASLFDGSQVITPEIVDGSEPLRFGPPRFP
jgi:hypothetical protein